MVTQLNSYVLSALAKNKMDSLNSLIAENEKFSQELNKSKILKYALEKVIQEDLENSRITDKLKQIVAAEETSILCQNLALLGLEVEHLNILCLSYTERSEVKIFLENQLIKECQQILQYDVSKGHDTVQSTQEVGAKLIPAELLELIQQQLNCRLQKWNEVLLKMKDTISDLLNFRREVKTIREKENSWFDVTSEALELEAKILAQQIQMRIYSENSYIIPAIEKVSFSAEADYCNTLHELEELKKKKEAYDMLEGTEYDDILQQYIQLKKEIDIKSWALNQL